MLWEREISSKNLQLNGRDALEEKTSYRRKFKLFQ